MSAFKQGIESSTGLTKLKIRYLLIYLDVNLVPLSASARHIGVFPGILAADWLRAKGGEGWRRGRSVDISHSSVWNLRDGPGCLGPEEFSARENIQTESARPGAKWPRFQTLSHRVLVKMWNQIYFLWWLRLLVHRWTELQLAPSWLLRISGRGEFGDNSAGQKRHLYLFDNWWKKTLRIKIADQMDHAHFKSQSSCC